MMKLIRWYLSLGNIGNDSALAQGIGLPGTSSSAKVCNTIKML